MVPAKQRDRDHDRRRVLADAAVTIAGGGGAMCDVAALRHCLLHTAAQLARTGRQRNSGLPDDHNLTTGTPTAQ